MPEYNSEQIPTPKISGFWTFLGSCFYSGTEDATLPKDSSHKIVSIALVWSMILAVLAILCGLFYFSYDLFALMLKENMGKTPLDKTPFVFVAVIFCAALMFLDSLIKTLKYKSRPQENIISLIIKNIGILMLLWYMLNK